VRDGARSVKLASGTVWQARPAMGEPSHQRRRVRVRVRGLQQLQERPESVWSGLRTSLSVSVYHLHVHRHCHCHCTLLPVGHVLAVATAYEEDSHWLLLQQPLCLQPLCPWDVQHVQLIPSPRSRGGENRLRSQSCPPPPPPVVSAAWRARTDGGTAGIASADDRLAELVCAHMPPCERDHATLSHTLAPVPLARLPVIGTPTLALIPHSLTERVPSCTPGRRRQSCDGARAH
jgi:hypothetical protein